MNKALAISKSPGFLAPVGSFDAFIQYAYRFPVLSADEEKALFEKFHLDNSREAVERLVLSHLRFVVKIARDYKGYGLPLEDVAQEGTVGLMKAVSRFDPSFGVRLVSFAVHWIRAEIYEYVIKNWRIVKVATTKAQRKLFFKMRQSKKTLGWFSEEQIHEVAEDLGVKPEVVKEMEQRLSARDVGFDAPDDGDDDGDSRAYAPQEFLADVSLEPSRLHEEENRCQNRSKLIETALASLKERERCIVETRWMVDTKATLNDLADEFGVSAERIRQIEKEAFKKMSRYLQPLRPQQE